MAYEILSPGQDQLPGAIQNAVHIYYTLQHGSGLQLPNPDLSEDVYDVAQTVINETTAHPIRVWSYLPQIKELMVELQEVFAEKH
jgi:hypothetical protein